MSEAENQANIFQGWFGLYMKVTYFIYFQIEDLSLSGKNLLAGSILKISVNGLEVSVRGKPITDRKGVGDVMDRFQSKYGQDYKKYYTNFDVAVKVRL